ncbi:MAG: SDR family NAD(P)-dependent oxidoreductase [Planctomycetaceae bacterium]
MEIAVIGMGCRFPGAHNVEAFWHLLSHGVDAIREAPEGRLATRTFFAPSPPKPGKSYSFWGGFLDGIDQFDPKFFGISPREAAVIDPQQRLLLEVGWEALEDAGLTQDWLSGRSVSVFVGASSSDYLQLQGQNYRNINAYTNAGGALSIVSNRLSYLFDLRGPSLTVDTACSSSLVAFHYACESLRCGESEAAVVGGVNVLLHQSAFIGFSQAHMLSPDGRCRSFDARGNGYVRAEGAGAVVLKPLRTALADGDAIHAVVLASGVNQDGRTAGMSLPNEEAQADLLRYVYRQAQVDTRRVSYLEAHGTGTAAGDPIEARAIGRVLGQGRSVADALRIGSVKSNIGHLEPASGMAGVIKTILSMKHGKLPATLHFQTPNPAIDFEALRLRVVAQQEAWTTAPDIRRIAGINSFGFGGTNAHVVLADSPNVSSTQNVKRSTQAHGNERDGHTNRIVLTEGLGDPTATPRVPTALIPLSAKSRASLTNLAATWSNWLGNSDSTEQPDFEDLVYTASTRRTHHEHRLAIVASSSQQLKELLDAWLVGANRKEFSASRTSGSDHSKTAFVFNGMGSQWQGMGEELLRREPVFREAVEKVDSVFQHLAGWSIVERLNDDEFRTRMNEAEVTQPCIFAVQVGLTAWWRSCGIEPDFIVGHSVGEAAASYVAGMLSLEDATRVIYHRSRLQHTLRGRGRMLALGLPAELAEPLLLRFHGSVSIAAINSPTSVTLSGDAEALGELRQEMEAQQTFCRFLQVDVPYHCDRMEAIRDELRLSLAGLVSLPAKVPFYSTVTGTHASDLQLDAEYWWQNVRQPVLFSAAMEELIAAGAGTFVEVGAHPVLMNSMNECAGGADKITVVPSLKRGEPQQAFLQSAIGRMFTLGRAIRWTNIYPERRQVIRLPAYEWQREAFWCEDESQRRSRVQGESESSQVLGATVYSLLGQVVRSAHQERAWHLSVSIDSDHGWIADHQVQGTPIFPAAGYIEQVLSAGRSLYPDHSLRLESVEILKALVLTSGRQIPIETVIDENSGDFHIDSLDTQGSWMRHVAGRVRKDFANWDSQSRQFHNIQSRCSSEQQTSDVYQWFDRIGLNYGPAFQGMESIKCGPGIAFAQLKLPGSLVADVNRFTLHPSMLDACMQLLLAASGVDSEGEVEATSRLYLPSRINVLRIHDPAEVARATVEGLLVTCQVVSKSESSVCADATIFDESGRAVVIMQGFEAVAFPTSRHDALSMEECLYNERWELRPRPGEDLADVMPAPTAIAAVANEQLAKIRETDWQNHYADFPAALNSQAIQFAADTMRKLGCEWTVGQRTTVSDLANQLGIANETRGLFELVLKTLARGKYLAINKDNAEFIAPLPPADGDWQWMENSRRWPAAHAEQWLARRIGIQLPEILRGTFDNSDESKASLQELLEQAMEDGPSFRNRNKLLQSTIASLVQQLPTERPIRILELYAGTGANATFVLPLLPPERTEYVLSDTPAAIQSARRKFREFSFVKFTEYQSPGDLLSQTDKSFDVIISPDVSALKKLAPLCATSGLLIVQEGPLLSSMESVNDLAWFALRPSVDLHGVEASLRSMALQHVTHLTDRNPFPQLSSQLWLAAIPARKQNTTEVAEAVSNPGVCLIVADDLDSAKSLADRLSLSGGRPVLVTPAALPRQVGAAHYELPFADAEAFGKLLQSLLVDGTSPKAIVHLAVQCRMASDNINPTEVRASQHYGINTSLAIAQAVNKTDWQQTPRVWLVTSRVHSTGLADRTSLGLAASPVWGLSRVLANEMPHLRCTTVDMGVVLDDSELESLSREIAADSEEREIVLRGLNRYVPRLHRGVVSNEPHRDSYRVAVATGGSMDSVELLPASRTQPGEGEIEIEVAAAAVNFKDVAKSLNLLTEVTLSDTWSGSTLGLECSGTITAVGTNVTGLKVGDRVVALASDCFRPYVVTRAEFVAPIPSHVSSEDAAGIPVVFLTAWYALNQLARVQPGDRVLIHAAAGGVGLAAIQIARLLGADIIATAGSPLKVEYLRAQGVLNVFDSRSLSFVDDVLRVTQGQGVDVVLNSLAGSAIPASLSLLRAGGRFVEIGKRDIQDNVTLGLRPFQNNLAFFSLDLDRLLALRPDLAQSLLSTVLQKFTEGMLTPLPCRSFPVSRTEEALRYIAKAKQIGKVVLGMHDPIARDRVKPTRTNTELRFDSHATYLVTGGLRGFGLATAQWLISHGARHLVLMSRSGADSLESQQAILELESAGAKILTLAVDVANETQLSSALATVRNAMPPMKGLFHAAMVLDDAMAMELNPDRMECVLAPKAWGALNLHRLTLNDPIEQFVLFSSATTVFGNPSQANYVAACTFLDQLAELRKAIGKPALSVAWGAIADVGYLSRNQNVLKHIEDRLGFRPVPAGQMLTFLEQILHSDRSKAALVAVNWPRFSPARFAIAGTPRLAGMVQQLGGNETTTTTAGRLTELLAAAAPDERRLLLREFLVKSLAGVLGIAAEQIELDRSLLTMGLDSLMAVELQIGLSRELEFELSPMRLLRGPTIQELTDELLSEIGTGRD